MITVYHVLKPNFDVDESIVYQDDKLRKVAVVDSDDLEYAYRYTQNIDSSWAERPARNVVPCVERARSTSVGDLMVNEEGRFIVSSFGYHKCEV